MPLAQSFLDFDPKRHKLDRGGYRDAWFSVLAALLDVDRHELEERDAKRRARTRNIITSATLIALAVVSGLAVFAWLQRGEAIAQRSEAIAQRDQALRQESRALAALAQSETRAGNAVDGMLLALRGMPVADEEEPRPLVTETRQAVVDATLARRELLVLRGHEGPISAAAFSPDSTRIVSGSASFLLDEEHDRLFRRRSAGEVARAPEAAGRLAYEDRLKQELGAVVDQLELSDLQKRCLLARWLDAVLWMDGKAKQAQRAYYALRLLIIIGGVIIPALVSLDLGSNLAAGLVRWTTFALSLLVAISAAIEGFFRYGERWRHYRAIVERLKIEGWQFFQLSAPYAEHGSHAAAYTAFAARVEEIIQSDVQQYITEVVREKQAATEQSGARPARPAPPSN